MAIPDNHRIVITTYFNAGLNIADADLKPDTNGVSTAKIRRLAFEFLPDSFKAGIKSNFNKVPLKLTIGQFLFYQGTDIEDITFTLRIVAGLDKVVSSSHPNLSAREDYLSLVTLAQELYSLTTPQSGKLAQGVPPPRSVLSVGSMFKGTGVFSSVDPEYFAPYDDQGLPQEMEVTFTFIPTQFYDPNKANSRLGVNIQTKPAKDISASDLDRSSLGKGKSVNGIESLLTQSPSGENIVDNSNGYIISLGPKGSF